jgi:hypothetical protein
LRVWRGLGNRDSSDKEWKEEFRIPAEVDTLGLVHDAFEHTDNTCTIEERHLDKAMMAFTIIDTIDEECKKTSKNTETDAMEIDGDKPDEVANNGEGTKDSNFDPCTLEDAITPLYTFAKCLKLAVMILLMNLCTIHGVSNSFAKELFLILHVHILLENNRLPKNL